MPAYASISEVKKKKDLILLATKATDMIEAAEEIKDILKENVALFQCKTVFVWMIWQLFWG
jgi:ketopantoate reductase